jgi:hypothetical protein
MTLLIAVTASLPITGCSPARMSAEEMEDLLGKDGGLPELPQEIAGRANVEIQSVRLTKDSESLSYPYSGSLRVWTLRMVLRNTGSKVLVLGDRCLLIESDSDGGTYDGMTQTRSGSQDKLAKYFGLSSSQENDEDNDALLRITGGMATWIQGQDPITPSFGGLQPRDRFVLRLESDDKGTAQAAASILRYITGRRNGPFGGETKTELAEDIRAWQSM